jgi:exosortase/archaeosortase family protein
MKKKRKKTKMQESNRYVVFLFLRYIILVIAGIFLSLFYKILFPLTVWPSYYLIGFLYNTSLFGNTILVQGARIEIIGACVAGSAYFLLLILNLTTKMNYKKRFYSLIFSFFSLLFLNIMRIFVLSLMFIEKVAFFDITHKLFWYFFSVLFVVGIWFLTAFIFKIKNIPIYSDIKYFLGIINKAK